MSPLASLSGVDPYITVRQGLSLGLVDLIIGLNYFLPWNGIGHPPSCHGLLVGSVSPPFASGLGHVSCLRQGDAGRQDTSRDLKCVCVIGLAVLCMLSLP